MTEFLSAEWFELLARESQQLPAFAGATADLVIDVGKRRAHMVVEDGHIVSAELDTGAVAPLKLACPPKIAQAMALGELDISVAFMRGQLKVDGDMGAMHRILPATAEPEFTTFLESVADQTTF